MSKKAFERVPFLFYPNPERVLNPFRVLFIFEKNKRMGSYVDNNLIKDEVVVYETKYHWKIFFTLSGLFTLFVAPALSRWSDEFVVTNKRIIVKTGIFSRRTLEMNLNKIESVNVDQNIFGRMFGYGTITIIGTGGTREAFPNIGDAVEFRKRFQEVSS